jgi:hypothetical protein
MRQERQSPLQSRSWMFHSTAEAAPAHLRLLPDTQ